MNNKLVEVVAGIILRKSPAEHWQVLIAKRLDHQHQGGLWEFPGGKIEENESPNDALKRELKEEIDLDVEGLVFFKEVTHDYSDKSVSIQFFTSSNFFGEAKGLEGQQIMWCDIEQLSELSFPEANQKVVKKLQSDINGLIAPIC